MDTGQRDEDEEEFFDAPDQVQNLPKKTKTTQERSTDESRSPEAKADAYTLPSSAKKRSTDESRSADAKADEYTIPSSVPKRSTDESRSAEAKPDAHTLPSSALKQSTDESRPPEAKADAYTLPASAPKRDRKAQDIKPGNTALPTPKKISQAHGGKADEKSGKPTLTSNTSKQHDRKAHDLKPGNAASPTLRDSSQDHGGMADEKSGVQTQTTKTSRNDRKAQVVPPEKTAVSTPKDGSQDNSGKARGKSGDREQTISTSKHDRKAQDVKPGMAVSPTPGASSQDLSGKADGKSVGGAQTKVTSKRKTEEPCVEVYFHLLMSEQIDFKPLEQNVCIVFGHYQLGGWSSRTRKLTCSKRNEDGLYKLTYSERLPARLVTDGSYFQYKYVLIEKRSSTEIWEEYTKQGRTGLDANRFITVPKSYRKLDTWHQYDGFFEKRPGFTGRLWNWWNDIGLNHAEKSVKAFFPNYEKGESALDFLRQLHIMFSGIKRAYFIDGNCWNNPKDFGKFINKLSMEILRNRCERHNEKEYTTILSLCVLLFLNEANADYFSDSDKTSLSRLLTVTSDSNTQTWPELEVVKRYLPDKRMEILSAIRKHVQDTLTNTKDPSWLYVMPWIHFLSGECKPFENIPLDMSHDAKEPKWWGISSVAHQINVFKNNSWNILPRDMVEKLQQLFKMDYLLPRTFLAVTDLKDLEELISARVFPVEICLANLVFHLKEGTRKYTRGNKTEKSVQKCMELLLLHLDDYFLETDYLEIRAKMSYKISLQMVNECTYHRACEDETLWRCVQMFLICVGRFEKSNTENQIYDYEFETAFSGVRQWMNTRDWNAEKEQESYVKVWNKLYAQDTVHSEKVRNQWNAKLSEELSRKFQNHLRTRNFLMSWFVKFYCKNLDDFNPYMQEQLSKIAFEAVGVGHRQDYSQFSDKENERFGLLLSKLFLTEWAKFENKSKSEEHVMVRFLLNWAAFSQYLKIYYNDERRAMMLSEECIVKVISATSMVEHLLTTLIDGSVTVDNLRLIKERQSRLLELNKLLPKTFSSDLVAKAVHFRGEEVNAFTELAKQVATLSSLCQSLSKVDKTEIESVMGRQAEINKYKVNELCKVETITEETSMESIIPIPIGFDASKLVVETLTDLQICFASSTFCSMWHHKCRKVGDGCETLDDVISVVWRPVKESFDSLANNIKSGEITFNEFERLFGYKYKEDFQAMGKELENIGLESVLISTRLGQLTKYRQLETCVSGAKSILEFASQYSLTGDFQQIRTIAAFEENDMQMKAFDERLVETCKSLRNLTEKQAECLKTFVECKELISWLKTSMEKSGLKELKVFVDLALMSAGEEPMNIARVQCLHTAVTGYAPLIFDLTNDAGFEELLNLCGNVWKELDVNSSLPEKLKDTARHLQWLEKIQKAHGSVEVTSMMQVEACNEYGEYTLGSNSWPKRRKANTSTMSLLQLEDILKLTVAGDEGKRETRNYNIEQLQDLQSRLMLVAGNSDKGTESVEKFTMIFDGALRLSNVYLKLCAAGCVLFKNWSACFFCDPGRPVCVILEFGETESQLKGRQSISEELRDIIPKLAGFMESCFDGWMQFIKEKRKKYHHLNYFTTDQLVILQRELVKIGTSEDPSHLIYPLLSAVKKECTREDLHSAMVEAKVELDGEVAKAEEEEAIEEDLTQNTNEDAEIEFVNELMEQGFSESLARKAYKHTGPDASEGFAWCMENNDADEEDDEPVPECSDVLQEPSAVPAFTGWTQSSESFQDVISSRIKSMKKQGGTGSAPLIKDLTLIWNVFLESISSNIQDYLSLEHLGLILKHLAKKDEEVVERKFPPNFEEGAPNLIVCRSGDILTTTLSVYSMDVSQPLPRSDEILMCTEQTTADEIDIFWRRSLFEGSKKIHCLVNADSLRFDVSEAAEKLLEDYMFESISYGLQYRLVVICGSDNEYRSSLVSLLDKYKRNALPLKMDTLKNYLKGHLVVNENDINGSKPAASVDKERSTVRVIKSWRSGVGKTLFKKRQEEEVNQLNQGPVISTCVSIPLQDKTVNTHYVVQRLIEHTNKPGDKFARLFHIDVAHEVQQGVDNLLFNLLILGYLSDNAGYVWRKSITDLYLVETLPLMISSTAKKNEVSYLHQILDILPDMTCRSPKESLELLENERFSDLDQLFDERECMSDVFQRPFQCLVQLEKQSKAQIKFNPDEEKGTKIDVLEIMLRHCGLQNPSWSELYHFVNFLNTQLVSFETNVFVSGVLAGDLPGFGQFVLTFLIHMSRDFATHSLDISEKTPGLTDTEDADENHELKQFQMRRTWESSPHPYLFFNEDNTTFTFLGFYIDKSNRDVKDLQTGEILERNIMTLQLYECLDVNGVPLKENFDDLSRKDKIQRLRNVMGINETHDPDDTYELTTDNVKKMMAIHMRFRCDIPVIVMGETGCGKTRLVKFMCALQIPPGSTIQNMIIMKVHGGTTNKDIIRKVKQAEKIAYENMKVKKDMFTVLFFDEANTTESVGLIKEIMCDKSVEGKKLDLCKNLKIVAACNPYRLHSEELIKKLEQAGLGYHVDADETNDRLGRVPMRRLVYRVQPLPQSLLPLVWDFGQLSTDVEKLYIKQMVRRYIENGKIPNLGGLKEVISDILTECQEYMRQQQDECSFVSLRDVDRTLTVMSWFYQQNQNNVQLFELVDEKIRRMRGQKYSLNAVTRSLVLALGVCYHACLKSRSEYRERIARFFQKPCKLENGSTQIADEIDSCQEVYLDNVQLEDTIARNMALKENVFMMVVCVELRLPLFLVGKPGSSKSLAKTIVSDAMQGNAAKFKLFRLLKHAQMVSFQCSPLSTPDGIVGTFRQCAQFQEDKDLDTFVSVVVLDEVGLAEDSPRMPLKTLHPLLEDGCQGEEEPKEYMKVAFIGISNWALDPAKMNRGILVQREVPDIVELKSSASGICQNTADLGTLIEPLIEPMAKSYLEVFNKASQEMREFFGLRDFYSLVKMVFNFVDKSKQNPSWHEMLHSIKRNFDGLETVDPVEYFKKHLSSVIHIELEPRETDPDCSPAGLIHACLFDTNKMNRESRYLLLITETYGALSIIQQQILSGGSQNRPITIFGSSFPSDQEYTQVCRNINKIKLCMEAGKTVLLLNLENLYESLYDALNQYYVYFGGDRYVDLGLGTHRVKCPVHKDFRLIVVAEKKTVYKVFPIPLINRLEKHFMNINTMLSDAQQMLVTQLQSWSMDFVGANTAADEEVRVGEHFVGYHEDACSAIIHHVCETNKTLFEADEADGNELDVEDKIFEEAKTILLWCATPDAVFRLHRSDLPYDEREHLSKLYLKTQAHGSFLEYIEQKLVSEKSEQLFSQVTTHSKLLGNVHKNEISKACQIEMAQILLIESLSSFDTEQQFTGKLQLHLKTHKEEPILVIIQCDSGHVNANLIACARFCAMDVFENLRDELTRPVHMIFVVHLPRIAGGCFTGFQCGVWHSVHIDDLYPEDKNKPQLYEMKGRSVAKLLQDAVKSAQKATDEEDTDEDDSVSLERVKGLILDCVQAALALVKDVEENKEREKLRIDLVMKLLYAEEPSDQTSSFLYGICCVIAKLLSEKEKETQGFIQPCDWMMKEATSSDKISEAGTFRRSCLKILESKVYPVLAGVIAVLDTNQNIDICKDEISAWKRELWLKVLSTPDALDVKYSDLQSPTRRSELQEAMVLYTGIGEKVFQSNMPFSWMFMSQINDVLLTTTKASYEDVTVLYQRILCLLKEIPLCRLLLEIEDQECITEGLKDYIEDFVCSVYNNGSHIENRVVCGALYKKTMALSNLSDERCLLSAVICVHLAYDDMANGLSYFRLMNSIWADCSSQILTLQAKTPKPKVLDADDIVLTAAFLLCQHVSPVKLDELSNRSQLKIDSSAKRIEWLRNLQQFRPVLEKTLCYLGQQTHLSTVFADETMHVKCHWERIIVMKLFVEHICLTREEKTYVSYCMPLWSQLTKLGADVNMKMIMPIKKLEDFMKLINKKHVKELLGDANECSRCERKLEGVPVKLQCGDLVCRGCFGGLRTTDRKCVTCKKVFPEDWEPTKENQNLKEKEIAILKEYQKKCNAFFMDMVSQLCFSENTAPSAEVIQRLLSFVTYDGTKESGVLQTKIMSIFDTGIDPTPVFRSFLLQLLLKTSMEDVKESMDIYLQKANDIIKKQNAELEQGAIEEDNTTQYIELCLMVIQCLEDVFLQEANSAEDEVRYASDALSCVTNDLNTDELSVNKLVCLAKARMGLTITAKYLNTALETNNQLPTNVKSLLKAAQLVCKNDCKCPRIYLVKTIARCYGLNQYYKLCSSEDDMLKWVSLPEAETDTVRVVSDRYIVCGEEYLRVREAVTEVALGGDITELDTLLQELGAENLSTTVFLDLTIHREITCSFIFPPDRRPFQDTSTDVFEKFISEKWGQRFSDIPKKELQNALIPKELGVKECLDIATQGLQCLIVHFMSVMAKLEGKGTLMQPLTSLITSANSCQGAFLPTMPQDNTDEVRDLLLKDIDVNKDSYYKKITLYKCPNGHIYLVTHCGKPMAKTKCMDCGVEIGGSGNHEAFDSNKLDDNTDETKPGHILGPAAQRSKNALPERELLPTFCACVRLLLHMSLYIGSSNDPDAICNIINDDVEKEDVSTFLWEHMKVDIENLENALGKSTDDVFICMHIAIDNIMKIHLQGDRVGAKDDVLLLSSKIARKEWEIKFTKMYLQDTFNNMEAVLKSSNEKIAGDKRLGGNPLLCLMHETQSVSEAAENPQMLQEVSRVWRFRTPITLEHMYNEFKSAEHIEGQCKVLRIFLEEEYLLRALRFVPSIQRLQLALLKKYHRKLDRSEGNTITIQTIIDEKTAGPDTQPLIKDFKEAWELIRMSLKTYVCRTDIGGVIVPEKLCNMTVTNDTPVSVLLPTTKGMGLCSFALLDFLMRRVQNGFLDNYLKETKRSYSTFLSVKPKELTSAHLISFDPQQDLLPLILANCQYTFEIGKGTTIQYDFHGLESQVIDRFLLSKSRIDVGPILQIDVMVYRTEVTNTAVFEKLAEKVQQVPLSHAVKTQVSGEMRTYPDLCESLVNMDIAISFLKSTGGNPEQNLHTFMTDVLRMNTSIASRTAQQSCQLQHCKKMWLHLSLLKSKMMADNNKTVASIFEGVRQTYQEKLQQEMIEMLDPLLRGFTIEKLAPLVEVLHEYIILYVSVDEKADSIIDQGLQDHLPVYIDLLYEEDDTDDVMNTVDELPADVLNRHCLPLWIMAYDILREKQTGDRKL